jgi:hypothetical protein
MAIKAYPLNNTDYSAADAQLYTCTRTSGVYSAESHCKVTAGSGMTVSVAPGVGWLKPTEYQGFCFAVTEAETLTVPDADATYSRIDGVHVRYDALAQSIALVYVPGTPAAAPAAPAPIRDGSVYELVLARVALPAKATGITSAMITDTRLTESLCGLMRDGVTRVPTLQLLTDASAAVTGFLTQNQTAISKLGKVLFTSSAGWVSGSQTASGISGYTLVAVKWGPYPTESVDLDEWTVLDVSGTTAQSITMLKEGNEMEGLYLKYLAWTRSGDVLSPNMPIAKDEHAPATFGSRWTNRP